MTTSGTNYNPDLEGTPVIDHHKFISSYVSGKRRPEMLLNTESFSGQFFTATGLFSSDEVGRL